MCKAVGDPHFQQFDGDVFDHQGECIYLMSEPVAASEKQPFQVLLKNYFRGGYTGASYAKYVQVDIHGIRVRLTNGDPGTKEEWDAIVLVIDKDPYL